MVDSVQDILLELDIFHLLVLNNDVFTDALHGKEFVGAFLLDQEDFTEGALSDHLHQLEVLELGRDFVPCKLHVGSSSHTLADLEIVRIEFLLFVSSLAPLIYCRQLVGVIVSGGSRSLRLKGEVGHLVGGVSDHFFRQEVFVD